MNPSNLSHHAPDITEYKQLQPLTGFPEKMAILDCETTGGKATRDRMTELAIILVDNGQVVEQWQSLIDPQTTIPPWITNITGIHNRMVEDAPTFEQLWPTIQEKLQDRVLVAHNARFDYGFLKNEARRCGQTLSLKTLCSVKLSRLMYPQFKKHSLDAIIQRLGTHVQNRHRAMDDTQVIMQLFEVMSLEFDEESIASACNRLLKRPSLPSQLDEKQLEDLPDSPGVYYFYNENHRLLYVGKSVNLKTRVLSHFYQDHQTTVDHHLSHQLHHIEFDETPSDFGAQILESQQVKTLSPSLNRRLKKVTKLYQYKLVEENGYLNIKIQAVTDTSQTESVFGLFRSRRQASNRLEKLVDEHFLCHRLSGLEKGKQGACFAFQVKKCMGACCQKEPAVSYNLRVENAMKKLKKQQWPFSAPVIVEEFNAVSKLKAFHLINDWCYLGKIKTSMDLWSYEPFLNKQNNNVTIQQSDDFFDLDIYFILIRFLLSDDLCKKAGLKITPLLPDTQIHFE
ncbi:MAG: GIY-YIG nuclease family protein [Thiotrichales bacterium]|nr:GIY-YIG nuclease family protein [Thiotrichales bacterium]